MSRAKIKHQVITKAGRPHCVQVPIAEWRRLEKRLAALEDASDQRAYDAAKTSGGETIPAAIVDSLLGGFHPVRVFREWRGMTQAELASNLGVTARYISQIESGRRVGTSAMLRSIATVLETDGELTARRVSRQKRPRQSPPTKVQQSDGHATVSINGMNELNAVYRLTMAGKFPDVVKDSLVTQSPFVASFARRVLDALVEGKKTEARQQGGQELAENVRRRWDAIINLSPGSVMWEYLVSYSANAFAKFWPSWSPEQQALACTNVSAPYDLSAQMGTFLTDVKRRLSNDRRKN